MSTLKQVLADQIPDLRKTIKNLVKEHGDKVISDVTVKQLFGGMRGVRCLMCETSVVDPEKGLSVRGIPIGDLADRRPEEAFFLLCSGRLPDEAELSNLQEELKKRSAVPDYVWKLMRQMPEQSHPMDMFNTAILACEGESIFRKQYSKGMKREDYWEAMYEDSLNIIAKLPSIAAGVYRIRFNKGELIPYDTDLGWSTNFSRMLGIEENPDGRFASLIRLYMVLHCDHESGNVSAHAAHLVGSALSDAYYSVSAGLNGLAGPLHGLANQECLKFVISLKEKYNGVPSDEELKQFTWDTLNAGKVIPGYGHAVLRATDPRYTAIHKFGTEHCSGDEIFQIVSSLYNVVPGVLKEHGKAANPWPNVDAISGSPLYHFGLTEMRYYTVLFAVSRTLGLCSQLIHDRAWGAPIERPKSVPIDWVLDQVGAKK